MKLEKGDAFESRHADWIRQYLPYYEPVWSAFIGHNGRGWPLPLRGLDAGQEHNRKKFYQAHYTFAIECYHIITLVDSIDKRSGFVDSFDSFLSEQQHLIVAVTAIGRIRDMFKIVDESLRMGGGLYGPLQEFYVLRSNIIHGPRMPVRIEDGFIMIPKIALQNATFWDWDDKAVWDKVDPRSFVYFVDYLRETRDKLFILLGDIHPKIFSAADTFFEGRRISENIDDASLSSSGNWSGLSSFTSASGNVPPSGVF